MKNKEEWTRKLKEEWIPCFVFFFSLSDVHSIHSFENTVHRFLKLQTSKKNPYALQLT